MDGKAVLRDKKEVKAEPSLTAPTESLNSTPETVSEVEPKSYQPDDVENYEYWVSEGVLNECEAI